MGLTALFHSIEPTSPTHADSSCALSMELVSFCAKWSILHHVNMCVEAGSDNELLGPLAMDSVDSSSTCQVL
eukprot:6384416-Amphidinium_carterae.2